jgi:hypothetical protein
MKTGYGIKADMMIVKEFFPKALALRDMDRKTVMCRLPSARAKYDELKAAFLQEALILKNCAIPTSWPTLITSRKTERCIW